MRTISDILQEYRNGYHSLGSTTSEIMRWAEQKNAKGHVQDALLETYYYRDVFENLKNTIETWTEDSFIQSGGTHPQQDKISPEVIEWFRYYLSTCEYELLIEEGLQDMHLTMMERASSNLLSYMEQVDNLLENLRTLRFGGVEFQNLVFTHPSRSSPIECGVGRPPYHYEYAANSTANQKLYRRIKTLRQCRDILGGPPIDSIFVPCMKELNKLPLELEFFPKKIAIPFCMWVFDQLVWYRAPVTVQEEIHRALDTWEQAILGKLDSLFPEVDPGVDWGGSLIPCPEISEISVKKICRQLDGIFSPVVFSKKDTTR